MANCKLEKSFPRGCKSTGGIYKALVTNQLSGVTDASQIVATDANGIITGFTGSLSAATWYEFTPNSTSASYVEEYQSDKAKGSFGYAKKFEGMYSEMTGEKQEIVKSLAGAYLYVLVHDKNDHWFLMGLDEGAILNGGSANTGAAISDGNNYTLVFGEESGNPSPEVDGTVIAGLTIA